MFPVPEYFKILLVGHFTYSDHSAAAYHLDGSDKLCGFKELLLITDQETQTHIFENCGPIKAQLSS